MWLCSLCTLLNNDNKRRCSVCGSRRTVMVVDTSDVFNDAQKKLSHEENSTSKSTRSYCSTKTGPVSASTATTTRSDISKHSALSEANKENVLDGNIGVSTSRNGKSRSTSDLAAEPFRHDKQENIQRNPDDDKIACLSHSSEDTANVSFPYLRPDKTMESSQILKAKGTKNISSRKRKREVISVHNGINNDNNRAPPSHWSCDVCTLDNLISRRRCAVCCNRRIVSSVGDGTQVSQSAPNAAAAINDGILASWLTKRKRKKFTKSNREECLEKQRQKEVTVLLQLSGCDDGTNASSPDMSSNLFPALSAFIPISCPEDKCDEDSSTSTELTSINYVTVRVNVNGSIDETLDPLIAFYPRLEWKETEGTSSGSSANDNTREVSIPCVAMERNNYFCNKEEYGIKDDNINTKDRTDLNFDDNGNDMISASTSAVTAVNAKPPGLSEDVLLLTRDIENANIPQQNQSLDNCSLSAAIDIQTRNVRIMESPGCDDQDIKCTPKAEIGNNESVTTNKSSEISPPSARSRSEIPDLNSHLLSKSFSHSSSVGSHGSSFSGIVKETSASSIRTEANIEIIRPQVQTQIMQQCENLEWGSDSFFKDLVIPDNKENVLADVGKDKVQVVISSNTKDVSAKLTLKLENPGCSNHNKKCTPPAELGHNELVTTDKFSGFSPPTAKSHSEASDLNSDRTLQAVHQGAKGFNQASLVDSQERGKCSFSGIAEGTSAFINRAESSIEAIRLNAHAQIMQDTENLEWGSDTFFNDLVIPDYKENSFLEVVGKDKSSSGKDVSANPPMNRSAHCLAESRNNSFFYTQCTQSQDESQNLKEPAESGRSAVPMKTPEEIEQLQSHCETRSHAVLQPGKDLAGAKVLPHAKDSCEEEYGGGATTITARDSGFVRNEEPSGEYTEQTAVAYRYEGVLTQNLDKSSHVSVEKDGRRFSPHRNISVPMTDVYDNTKFLHDESSRSQMAIGFYTAGTGKILEVTEQNLRDATNLLSEESSLKNPRKDEWRKATFRPSSACSPIDVNEYSVMSTPSPHDIDVFTGAQKQNVDTVISECSAPQRCSVSFHCAGSGKIVDVSEQALLKAERLIEGNQPLGSEAGSKINEGNEALSVNKFNVASVPSWRDEDAYNGEHNEKGVEPQCCLVSFHCAGSGKIVDVSEQALLKAERLIGMNQPLECETSSKVEQGNVSFLETSKNRFAAHDDERIHAQTPRSQVTTDSDRNECFVMSGPLRRDDEVYTDEHNKEGVAPVLSYASLPQRCSVSFHSAGSGKIVDLSEQALLKAERLIGMNQPLECETGSEVNTRSGSILDTSKNRIAAHENERIHAQTPRFQVTTISDKNECNVTSGSSRHDDEIYTDEHNKKGVAPAMSSASPPQRCLVSFHCAGSGKIVDVSEQALLKAERLIGMNQPLECETGSKANTRLVSLSGMTKNCNFAHACVSSKTVERMPALPSQTPKSHGTCDTYLKEYSFTLTPSRHEDDDDVYTGEHNKKVEPVINCASLPQRCLVSFHSAGSGKIVDVSEQALLKAERLIGMNQPLECETSSKVEQGNVSFLETSKNRIAAHDISHITTGIAAENASEHIAGLDAQESRWFTPIGQNGKSRRVSFSAEAHSRVPSDCVAECSNRFINETGEDHSIDTPSHLSSFSDLPNFGFQISGTRMPIKISELSMANASRVLNDDTQAYAHQAFIRNDTYQTTQTDSAPHQAEVMNAVTHTVYNYPRLPTGDELKAPFVSDADAAPVSEQSRPVAESWAFKTAGNRRPIEISELGMEIASSIFPCEHGRECINFQESESCLQPGVFAIVNPRRVSFGNSTPSHSTRNNRGNAANLNSRDCLEHIDSDFASSSPSTSASLRLGAFQFAGSDKDVEVSAESFENASWILAKEGRPRELQCTPQQSPLASTSRSICTNSSNATYPEQFCNDKFTLQGEQHSESLLVPPDISMGSKSICFDSSLPSSCDLHARTPLFQVSEQPTSCAVIQSNHCCDEVFDAIVNDSDFPPRATLEFSFQASSSEVGTDICDESMQESGVVSTARRCTNEDPHSSKPCLHRCEATLPLSNEEISEQITVDQSTQVGKEGRSSPCDAVAKTSTLDSDELAYQSTWLSDSMKCLSYGVSPTTVSITSESASYVVFDLISGKPDSIGSSLDLANNAKRMRLMLSQLDCDPAKICDKWIINHSRWIIWKLASIERRMASYVGGSFLSFDRVASKLQERYIKEIQGGARSSVRKILNLDASAACMVILCVARISQIEIPADKVGPSVKGSNCTLELTDGWYSLNAVPDARLRLFVETGKIRIGTKLCISRARLMGCESGIDPLDESYDSSRIDAPFLQISANSTRLARWHSKLGFIRSSTSIAMNTGTFLTRSISDVLEGGGAIPLIQLKIKIKYPIMYLERNRSGDQCDQRNRVLTEPEETARLEQLEKRKQNIVELHTEDVQASCLVEVDESAPDLWHRMMKEQSPHEFYEALNTDERVAIDRWRERRSIVLQDRMKDEMTARFEDHETIGEPGLPFLRMLVESPESQSDASKTISGEEALLTIWNPSSEQLESIREGIVVSMKNVDVRPTRYEGRLQLTANEKTPMDVLKKEATLSESHHVSSGITSIQIESKRLSRDGTNITTRKRLSFVGIVLHAVKDDKSEDSWVYVTDESSLIVRVICTARLADALPILELQRGGKECSDSSKYGVAAFSNFNLEPFDYEENCVVVSCGPDSSICRRNESRRLSLLRNYESLPEGRNVLHKLVLFTQARLLRYRRGGHAHFTAIGYIVGFRAIPESNHLLIEVDCGDTNLHTWRFPLQLMAQLVRTTDEENDEAILSEDATDFHTRLGFLGNILTTTSNSRYQFLVRHLDDDLQDFPLCKYEVTKATKIGIQSCCNIFQVSTRS